MELQSFCPRCGENTELIGSKKKICGSCYTKENTIAEIPDQIKITICPVCGRMKHEGDWIELYSKQDQIAEALSEYNRDEITMNVQFWSEDDETHILTEIQMQTAYEEHRSKLKVENEQCETCSKFKSGYYKTKIQIRGKDIEDAVNVAAERAATETNKNRENFLSNIERNQDGADLFVSTTGLADKIISTIEDTRETKKKRSYELVGEKDGQEIYKNVVSLRVGAKQD